MKSKEKEYFNKIADIFDTHFNVYSKPAGTLRVKRRIGLFLKHCRLKPGFKILEIGCGTGQYSKELLDYGINLFGIDISYNMLNKAIDKIRGQGHFHFFACDVEELSVKDNVFDLLVGNSILHHLNVEKAVNQISRVLKQGGRFFFSEPNMLNPQIFLQKNIKFIKRLSGDAPEETAFTRWYIKKILKKAGFRDIYVTPFDFLHPYLPGFLVNIINNIGLVLEKTVLIKEVAGSLLITGMK